MVQAAVQERGIVLAEVLDSWENGAYEGVSALSGTIVKVEYYDADTGTWKEWLTTVSVPVGTGVAIRCTVRNDTNVIIGLAVDFYMADPDDWSLGQWTLFDPGPYVKVATGGTLISEDYRFTILKVGLHDVLFVLRGSQ